METIDGITGYYASSLNRELDILTIKEIKANKNHNNISFNVHMNSEHVSRSTLCIIDHDCQLSRRYTIGKTGELEMGEDKVLIESFDQVIEVWETGAVWF